MKGMERKEKKKLKKKRNEEALGFFQKALDAGSNYPHIYRYISESFEDLKMHENAGYFAENADVQCMYSCVN
jgi:hypothetical protein